MSRRPDMQAIALQLAAPTLAPLHDGPDHQLALYGGGRRHSNRRVVYERRQQHLFGRWTEERITIEVDDESWLDRHENTKDSRHGDETVRWLR